MNTYLISIAILIVTIVFSLGIQLRTAETLHRQIELLNQQINQNNMTKIQIPQNPALLEPGCQVDEWRKYSESL